MLTADDPPRMIAHWRASAERTRDHATAMRLLRLAAQMQQMLDTAQITYPPTTATKGLRWHEVLTFYGKGSNSKTCKQCQLSLLITNFSACATANDGLHDRCKRCVRIGRPQVNSKTDAAMIPDEMSG